MPKGCIRGFWPNNQSHATASKLFHKVRFLRNEKGVTRQVVHTHPTRRKVKPQVMRIRLSCGRIPFRKLLKQRLLKIRKTARGSLRKTQPKSILNTVFLGLLGWLLEKWLRFLRNRLRLRLQSGWFRNCGLFTNKFPTSGLRRKLKNSPANKALRSLPSGKFGLAPIIG